MLKKLLFSLVLMLGLGVTLTACEAPELDDAEIGEIDD